jgi:hypothetical protein
MKRKKFKNVFIVLLLILLFFSILLLYSPYLISFFLPYIFNKQFDRELTIKKIDYSILKTELVLNDIELKTKNHDHLLSIKKLFIDFDFSKIIFLKFSTSSVVIDGLSTFIISNENIINLPAFIVSKKNTTFSMPFNIEELKITNSNIDILQNNKLKPLISELNIFVPGISSKHNQELSPEIRGKFNGKDFNIKGKTLISKNQLSSIFDIRLTDFDVSEISRYLPDIRKIKIINAIADANININFITSKNKAPFLLISGDMEVKNLYLKDLNNGKNFITNGKGSIKIKKYDVFNNQIELDNITLREGICNIYYSRNENEASTFFIKRKNIKKPFKSEIKEFNIYNINVNFYNMINNSSYEFFGLSALINNFSNYKNDPSIFKLNSTALGLENIKATGSFVIKEKKVIFDNLDIINLDTKIFKISINDKIKSLNINKYAGYLKIEPGNYSAKGLINLGNMKIELPCNNYFLLNNAELKFNEFDNKSKNFSFEYLNCNIAHLPLSKDSSLALKDLSFSIDKKANPYSIEFDKSKNKISINNIFNLKNINGIYDAGLDKKLDFKIKNADIDLIFDIIYKNPLNLQSKIKVDISNLICFNAGNPVLKVNSIKASVDKIKYSPLYINFNYLTINSPQITVEVKKDKKLYLLSVISLDSSKTKHNTELNIDKININSGKINFTDYSLDKTFNANLNDLTLNISHYPSNVYPEGKYDLQCLLNDRNKITSSGIISVADGLSGTIDSKNIYLPFLTIYSNNYLGYKINSGTMNIRVNFKISLDELNIKTHMELIDLKLAKNNEYLQKSNIDLVGIIQAVKDNQEKIILDIPVNGKLNNPEIDFRALFFDMFLKIIANMGKDINSEYFDFIEDGDYDIVEFYPGSDEFTIDKSSILLNNVAKKSKTSKIVFLINVFIDKEKDTPVIKEQILNEKLNDMTTDIIPEDSPEEHDLLIKVYNTLSNDKLPADLSNKELKKMIIQKINVDDNRYYALSYKRVNKVKELLIDKYDIPYSRIKINEKNIYEKLYNSSNNCIAVIKSGNNRTN